MSTIEPRTFPLKDGEAVLIRTATPDDAARTLAILTAAVAEGAYTLAEPGERPTSEEEERRAIEEHVARDGDLFLVAEAEGEVVGWVAFESDRLRRTRHRGEFSMFIDARWRGRGVGTALLEALLAWAAAHPVLEKVALAVFSTNDRAQALYRKLGFVEEGHCPSDMKLADGTYIDSVLMYRFVKEPAAEAATRRPSG